MNNHQEVSLATFIEIFKAINRAKNILLVTHGEADGDAAGSILALAKYLCGLKKNWTALSQNFKSASYFFLPLVDQIQADPKEINLKKFDLIISLDIGDLKRSGLEPELLVLNRQTTPVINIDHHSTVTYYGDFNLVNINLVNPKASSTAEILFDFFNYSKIPIDQEMATALLAGIIIDTGAFSNLGTTAKAMEVASELLNKGASLIKIVNYTLRNKSFPLLKLWGRALARLKLNEELNIVTTIITQNDLNECGATEDDCEGIANFLNNLKGAKIIVVVKEQKDNIKVSLRTTDPKTNVARLAEFFGGGGHPKAAGFSIPGRLKKIEAGWQVI